MSFSLTLATLSLACRALGWKAIALPPSFILFVSPSGLACLCTHRVCTRSCLCVSLCAQRVRPSFSNFHVDGFAWVHQVPARSSLVDVMIVVILYACSIWSAMNIAASLEPYSCAATCFRSLNHNHPTSLSKPPFTQPPYQKSSLLNPSLSSHSLRAVFCSSPSQFESGDCLRLLLWQLCRFNHG